jgi:hypothetical protein
MIQQSPEYSAYLRATAGFALKNQVIRVEVLRALPLEVIQYVKECAFVAIADPMPDVQKTSGILITAIVRTDVSHSLDVVQRLVQLIEGGSPAIAQVSRLYPL